MCKIIVLFLVLFGPFSFIYCQEGDSLRKKKAGFLFTIPPTLSSGGTERVCITLHEGTVPSNCLIDLKWTDKHFLTKRQLESEHECFDLEVPKVDIAYAEFVHIKVQVELNGIIYSAHNQDPILIYPNEGHKTFIQTDKPWYKPGDKVKLRFLVLGKNFKPSEDTIQEVKVVNPMGMGVALWENVPLQMGLSQLEYHLVHESIPGKWTVTANQESLTFEVNRYVKPRFKIELKHPVSILIDDPNPLEIEVCAVYSFGRNVNGYSFIKITESELQKEQFEGTKTLYNGCAKFSIDKAKFKLNSESNGISLIIKATVTEDGTSKLDVVEGKIMLKLNPYEMAFIGANSFLPGLPYKGELRFNNILRAVQEEKIKICYNVAFKQSYNFPEGDRCFNLTVNLTEPRSVNFTIPPLKNGVVNIALSAAALNKPFLYAQLIVVRLHSNSGNHILIENGDLSCRKPQSFTITYNTEKLISQNMTFYYIVKSRGRILKTGRKLHSVQKEKYKFSDVKHLFPNESNYFKQGAKFDSFTLEFQFGNEVVTNYSLIVYYIFNSGEIIAYAKSVKIEPCLLNLVQAYWSQRQAQPGSSPTLNIKTSSPSLCSVSAIDKAISYSDIQQKTITLQTILNPFLTERFAAPSKRYNCVFPKRRSNATEYFEAGRLEEAQWQLRRRKRQVFSEDYDALDTFNQFGTITITNLKLLTKPCVYGPPLYGVSVPIGVSPMFSSEFSIIRNNFPDTWLWELIPVERNVAVLKRDLPDSITSWKTNVFCVSNKEGIGFGNEFELTGFQPFFIDIVTPQYVKQEEIFYAYVKVFNYFNHSIPIRVAIESKSLELMEPNQNQVTSHCIPSNSTTTKTLTLKTTQIGQVELTAMAELDSDYHQQCGPESILYMRDVVHKTIEAEPEGYPIKITKSAMLCPSTDSSSNISWDLELPEEIVPNTEKAYVVVSGDLLGPAVANLEKLLSVPTGCGEQVMASMAPNLFVLKYLNATNSLSKGLKLRILRNLKIGYQRILNFAHTDGSFSAFGKIDSKGSMFLTAFVVRVLKEAGKFVYVEEGVVRRAVEWIFAHQLENGCFDSMLHVFQDMGGNHSQGSTSGMTAYVMLSLSEVQVPIPKHIETNTKYCIRSLNPEDKYTLAISCYALFKVKWISEAKYMLRKLLQKAVYHQNTISWTTRSSYTSRDLEISSYALMALLEDNTSESLGAAHGVARWLSSKLGPNGGFKTTQDTVVSLDALSRYSILIGSSYLDLEIGIKALFQKQNLNIQGEDRLKTKKFVLKKAENHLEIEAEGNGCVLVQAVLGYYLKNLPENQAFRLNTSLVPVSTSDKCSIAELSHCLAYTGPEAPSNMAVLEVGLPSGYQADRASLYHLLDSNTNVKKFEELNNQVNLYFTKLGNNEICINFKINEDVVVEARKGSLVKLYDYYKPEYKSLGFYAVDTLCKEEKLPLVFNFTGDDLNEDKERVRRSASFNSKFTLALVEESNGVRKKTNDNSTKLKDRPKRQVKGLNPAFVDLDQEMEAPKCMVVYSFAKPDNNVTRVKRQLSSFKDIDLEMSTPNCMPIPSVVKPKVKPTGKPRTKRQNPRWNPLLKNKKVVIKLANGKEQTVDYYNKPGFVDDSDEIFKKNRRRRFLNNKPSKTSKTEGLKEIDNESLNPSFVNMDMEMAMPDGVEGNIASYVKPTKQELRNMTFHG